MSYDSHVKILWSKLPFIDGIFTCNLIISITIKLDFCRIQTTNRSLNSEQLLMCFLFLSFPSSCNLMLKEKKGGYANQFLLLLNLLVTKIEVMYSIVSYWDEWWIQNWFWNWCLANTIIGNAKALIWYMAGAASSSKITYSKGRGLEKKKNHSMWTLSS